MSAGGEGTAAGGDDAMLFLPLSVRLPRFLPSSTTLCLSLPLSVGTLVEPTAALLIFDERVLSSQRLSSKSQRSSLFKLVFILAPKA